MNEQSGNEKNMSVNIAKALGISQSTVSRALRHCGGVDSDTRKQILLCVDPSEALSASECDIYVILPDTPRYFWEGVKKGIIEGKKGSHLSVKFNLYTNVRDEDAVLCYLNEADTLKAKVVILSAIITPAIRERLMLLQKKCAVFLVTEGGDVPNSFYFGADAYSDGFRMGSIFCECFSSMTPIAVNVESNYNVSQRTKGFTDALRQYDEARFGAIPMFYIHHTIAADPKRFPSKLAAELAEQMGENEAYCLYIPFGNVYQSRVFLKAKRENGLICLTHDCIVGEDGRLRNGIAVTVNQNTFVQGEAAIRAAIRYVTEGIFPSRKYTFISSEIRQHSEKTE